MILGLSIFSGSSFSGVVQWVIHNSYPLLFVCMVIEGPVVIAAASFAASLGYLSLPLIFALAILGDLVGDFIWYAIGYFSRITLVNRFGHLFGATPSRMLKLKQLLEQHPLKILAAIKISPLAPIPGLIITGSSHLSPRKFAATVLTIIIPKTVLFMVIGYFFGNIYEKASAYLNGIYTVIVILIVIIGIYYLYRALAVRLATKLERGS